MASWAKEDRIDFDSLPPLDREWARREAYAAENARLKRLVAEAKKVPKDERTPLQHRLIGYHTDGTADPHNF